MSEIIRFSCPLPPPELRSNSRHHWYARAAAKRAYSQEVYIAWCQQRRPMTGAGIAWAAAQVTYTWRFCGRAPDKANLGGNLKALQDFLACAPNTGKQRNDCTYLGIVTDDRHIDPVFKLEAVKHRQLQGVDIVIERRR